MAPVYLSCHRFALRCFRPSRWYSDEEEKKNNIVNVTHNLKNTVIKYIHFNDQERRLLKYKKITVFLFSISLLCWYSFAWFCQCILFILVKFFSLLIIITFHLLFSYLAITVNRFQSFLKKSLGNLVSIIPRNILLLIQESVNGTGLDVWHF